MSDSTEKKGKYFIQKNSGYVLSDAESRNLSKKDRPKLDFDQQIAHFEKKGILFTKVNKEEAADFLKYNTYMFKVKAYAKNYGQYAHGDNAGKYCGLEFAYLRELSTLDMYLRTLVLKMTLDIEHYLKVKLLRELAQNDNEDGYGIVKEFLETNTQISDEIKKKSENSFTKEMVATFGDEWAVWNLVEVLTFGQFIDLYKYYYNIYDDADRIGNQLQTVRFIRNAAAHNNCLINDLNTDNNFQPSRVVLTFLNKEFEKREIDITAKVVNKKMKNRAIHDFVVTLYVFDKVVTSEGVKRHVMEEITNFFEERAVRHADYFKQNQLICSSYKFVKNAIDIFKEN